MKKFYVGALTATALIGVGSFAIYDFLDVKESQKNLPVEKKIVVEEKKFLPSIGFIDLEIVKDSLPQGGELSNLIAKETRLQLELNNAMQPVLMTPPKVEDKPFDDSVWQKNAQAVVSEAAEIEKRKRQAAEDYRKQTEADYIKRRDEANDQFLNEILNIKLKLQNADVMRLSEEEIKNFNHRLDEIQAERNQIQKKLIEEWTKEIADYAEESIKDDVENLRKQAKESVEKVKLQAQQAKVDAIKRNNEMMEQAMKESAKRQELRQQILSDLQEVTAQRQQLESDLIDSLSDVASKLAVINKLNLLLVKQNSFDEENKISFSTLFATSLTLDLTDELIKELQQ